MKSKAAQERLNDYTHYYQMMQLFWHNWKDSSLSNQLLKLEFSFISHKLYIDSYGNFILSWMWFANLFEIK